VPVATGVVDPTVVSEAVVAAAEGELLLPPR
jgi:hypothetical protein